MLSHILTGICINEHEFWVLNMCILRSKTVIQECKKLSKGEDKRKAQ